MREPDYLLTNSEPETADRFDGLDQAFDAVSIGHLQRLGVGTGARCLEIGAGSGSIARWLAGQVGPAGQVVATDLDARWFRHDGSPQLEIRSSTWSATRSPTAVGRRPRAARAAARARAPRRARPARRLAGTGRWILIEDFDRRGPHIDNEAAPRSRGQRRPGVQRPLRSRGVPGSRRAGPQPGPSLVDVEAAASPSTPAAWLPNVVPASARQVVMGSSRPARAGGRDRSSRWSPTPTRSSAARAHQHLGPPRQVTSPRRPATSEGPAATSHGSSSGTG
jgi:hypothetical protein